MNVAAATKNALGESLQIRRPFCLNRHRALVTIAVAASLLAAAPRPAEAAPRHIPLASRVAAPVAASDLCARYAWACKPSKRTIGDTAGMMNVANDVNRAVNRRVRSVDDLSQYRKKDFWSLPSNRGGDCEDVALLKKRELIQRGIPADRLLIATVHSRKIGPHAVLVLRMEDGDKVLDSLNSRIKPWHQTGYTFLRVQNPKALNSWVSVSSKG